MSKRVFQENKTRQIFRKTNICNPVIHIRPCTYQGVSNVRFFGKFDVLCFLETPILRFALLPYYLWTTIILLTLINKEWVTSDPSVYVFGTCFLQILPQTSYLLCCRALVLSSPLEVFYKKGVFKISQKFQKATCVGVPC